jgi:hypothetical protein
LLVLVPVLILLALAGAALRILLSPTLALLLVVPFALGVFLRVLLGGVLLARLLARLFFVIHF